MISKRFQDDSRPGIKLNALQLKEKEAVEKKIREGQYQFEKINCPVCQSTKSELLSEKDRYGLRSYVVVCTECGLVYTNPRMTQESYNEFYDHEYRKLYVGDDIPTQRFFSGQYNKGKAIFSFIRSTFTELEFNNLNVLEIGCGAGGILYYFKQQGCLVKGFDLGSEYLQYGKNNYDLDLIHGSLKDVSKEYHPDIIIYSHVMEHILDLNSELNRIREMCGEKTILYIEVPGIRNIHQAYQMDFLLYLQNAHTFHFSLSSLTNILIKNGFKRIRGTEYIRSIFMKDDSQTAGVETICEYPQIVDYLKSVEKKKYLYPFKLSTLKKMTITILTLILRKSRLSEPLKRLMKKSLPKH